MPLLVRDAADAAGVYGVTVVLEYVDRVAQAHAAHVGPLLGGGVPGFDPDPLVGRVHYGEFRGGEAVEFYVYVVEDAGDLLQVAGVAVGQLGGVEHRPRPLVQGVVYGNHAVVDIVGDLPENRTGHLAAVVSALSRVVDHDDDAVHRFLGREVAGEARLVLLLPAALAVVLLAGTGLARKAVFIGLQLVGRSALHYAFEERLQFLDGFLRSDLLVHHRRAEVRQRLAFAAHLFHYVRLHHLAAVGYGVKERQHLQGGQTGFVAEGKPGVGDARPLRAAGVVHHRRTLAGKLDARLFAQVKRLQAGGEFAVGVQAVRQLRHRNVGGLFEGLPDGDHVPPLTERVGVRYFHLVVGELLNAVFDVDFAVQRNFSVFQQGHHRGQFKSRTRFRTPLNSVVVLLEVFRPVGVHAQVGDGADGAGLYVHHYRRAPVRSVLAHGAVQGVLGDVLNVYVQGRVHVGAGGWFHDGEVVRRQPDVVDLTDAEHIGLTALSGKFLVEGILDADHLPVDLPDRTAGEPAKGALTLVFLRHDQPSAETAEVKDGEALDLL